MTRNPFTSGNRLSTTTFGSSVGLSSLSANREATTVSQTPECLNIRESPDVQLSLTTKVTLDEESSPLDSTSYSSELFIIEISNAGRFSHA
jgi:hypothetical protein